MNTTYKVIESVQGTQHAAHFGWTFAVIIMCCAIPWLLVREFKRQSFLNARDINRPHK